MNCSSARGNEEICTNIVPTAGVQCDSLIVKCFLGNYVKIGLCSKTSFIKQHGKTCSNVSGPYNPNRENLIDIQTRCENR
eukprot:UN07133